MMGLQCVIVWKHVQSCCLWLPICGCLLEIGMTRHYTAGPDAGFQKSNCVERGRGRAEGA